MNEGTGRYSPLDQIVMMPPQFARLVLDEQTVRGWRLDEICDVNDKLGTPPCMLYDDDDSDDDDDGDACMHAFVIHIFFCDAMLMMMLITD